MAHQLPPPASLGWNPAGHGKRLRRAGRGLFARALIAPAVALSLARFASIGEGDVVVGALALDLLLGDVHTLKEKRSVVRPIVADLRRRFDVAAAETGDAELYRRCEVAVAVVASTHRHAVEVLERCERFVAGRSEVEVLSARHRVLDDDDLG
jgi:uncharacterized protein